MIELIKLEHFKIADLTDTFFISLKKDYVGFEDWYAKKAEQKAMAYVLRAEDNTIQAFLYLKIEDDEILDIEPHLPAKHRLKIGTFKVNGHSTRVGERFFKKIFDYAMVNHVQEVYVTIFDKEMQRPLIEKLQNFGFKQVARKGEELVLLKDLSSFIGEPNMDYPKMSTCGCNKYVLGIKPMYHSLLFPDSSVLSERYDLMQDVSVTNSIHKVYISFIEGTASLKKGDLLAIYRTTDISGRAWFRSVVTSICVVEETKIKADFVDEIDFCNYVKGYSVFSQTDLHKWYNQRDFVVIKMTYNLALTKRVTRASLVENIGVNSNVYWGFFPLTDNQFGNLLKRGEADETYFIN